MIPDIIAQLEDEVERAKQPEVVTVLVASRDEEVIRQVAPRVARRLYSGMSFGDVLWHEPHPPLDEEHEWSEAAVRVGQVGVP